MLSHRTGRREIALYDPADPDASSAVLHLSPDDTRTLGELLGASPVSEAIVGVQRLEGVAIDWITIRRGSEQIGATIGGGQLRARTGISVVALVQRGRDAAGPGARPGARVRRRRGGGRYSRWPSAAARAPRGVTPIIAAAVPEHDAAVAFIEIGAVALLLSVLARSAARLGITAIPLYLLAGLARRRRRRGAPRRQRRLHSARR